MYYGFTPVTDENQTVSEEESSKWKLNVFKSEPVFHL